MCEPETKVPQPHSPSPSHAAPRFQLQPSTPEISTRYTSNPNLLKRMQESTCFNCGQKGHWSWYCPLNSPNNNNNNNLSPVSTKRILCRCGHGFCDVKTAHSSNNWGRDYFVCPIKRGARCKSFVGWCDDPIKESDLQPPLFKYPECECGAGVCRRVWSPDRRVWSPNEFKYYFECPIKQDHGSCGYCVSEDEVLNNTSIVPMPEDEPLNNTSIVPMMEDELLSNTSIVPIRQIRQRSLHEFSEDQNDTTDNDIGKGAGSDLFVTTKRMRIIDNFESPSPMALSEIPKEKDGGSLIDEDDLELTHLAWEAIEAAVLSRLSTPSRIHRRQSLFDRDIAGAADASFGSCPMGWLGRLIFVHPTQSLKFPPPQPFFCCIFPSFDPIVVPEQSSPDNDHSKCNDHAGISKDIVSPNKSPSSESKLVSMSQIQRDVVKFTQQRLLSDLENLDPHRHESMAEAAESTFEVLNRLGVECNQVSEHIWDFIRLASSLAEMDQSMENSPTLEEHNKLFEEVKAKLAHMRDNCIKTEALLEMSKKKGKSLCEEVSHLEAMLYQKRIELKSCESETMKMETKLGDMKRDMLEVDINLKDRAEQMELARKKSVERHAKQIAAQAALEKAKLVLEN